jgi:protein-disulfide isomerase
MRSSIRAVGLSTVLWALSALTVAAQVDGNYERIGTVPAKNSLDTILVEEYINFTCPHCNNFRSAAIPLYQKYAKRIDRRYVPILFRGQNDAALRLFVIAQKNGKEEEIVNALFDATFKYGVNINDPAIVNYLARSSGLAELYERDYAADWVGKKIAENHQKADAAGVSATPTLVLNNALRVVPQGGMQEFVGNVDRLIGQLLKP